MRVCQFGVRLTWLFEAAGGRVGVGNVHSRLLPKQAFCSGSPERMIVPTFTACRVELLSMAAPPPTLSLAPDCPSSLIGDPDTAVFGSLEEKKVGSQRIVECSAKVESDGRNLSLATGKKDILSNSGTPKH